MIQEENKIQEEQTSKVNEESAPKNVESTPEQEAQQDGAAQQEEPKAPTSYAVRPHHRQRRLIDYDGRDKMLKVRNKLNITFMLLAIIGLILWTQTDYQNLSIIILLVGVVLKIIEVCLRLFKK